MKEDGSLSLMSKVIADNGNKWFNVKADNTQANRGSELMMQILQSLILHFIVDEDQRDM